eukprot:gene5584-11255_t
MDEGWVDSGDFWEFRARGLEGVGVVMGFWLGRILGGWVQRFLFVRVVVEISVCGPGCEEGWKQQWPGDLISANK